MSVTEALILRRARNKPRVFRDSIRLSSEHTERFGRRVQPWQQRDFAALDDAWRALLGHSVPHAMSRAYIERPRGHSKTSDMAVQIAWLLLTASRAVNGIVAAADRDQANLVWEAVRRIQEANPGLCRDLRFLKHLIVNTKTNARLEVISSDVGSSWGALPDFVICDELCHWEKPDLFQSLVSSAAKKSHCVIAILTNAGVGRGWQWELREHARTSPNWYFSTLDGCQAPWITEEWLDEQRKILPPPVFARLWQNEWQHSDGEFVTLAAAEACRDPHLEIRHRARPGMRYVAAIDYAEKRDYTVGVVVHREGDRVIVDRMDVAVPGEMPVPVAWVEEWIERIAHDFRDVEFVVDEYQLLGPIQKLSGLHRIHRFEFLGGKGNHALAMTLRRLIVERQVAWYPDCGAIETNRGRDDLETELASLLLKQSASGRCRLDHRPQLHDDRGFALGAACLHLLSETGPADWLLVTPPGFSGGFAL